MTKSISASLGALAFASALMGSTAAYATEGYFSLGFGPRQTALGGSGVADSRDAMALALNPAGIAGIDEEVQVGVGAFMPFRGYDTTGPGFVAPGSIDSDKNIFPVPNLAYVRPIDEDSSFGITLYGNGGMNTSYAAVANPACMGGTGVFCGGKAGVDLIQAFVSAGYARRLGALKFGIAPTVAIQRFKARGLAAFSGVSSDPANLTNQGYDYSYGGGIKAGIEFDATDSLRFALAGQTKMYMTKFDDYAGLFENQGDFDIPAQITAGVAFDVNPDLTLMLDYQHIFYKGVGAVSDATTTPLPLGSDGGPGFGWSDVDAIKLGAEWRASEQWTFRAGYAYNNNPVGSSDVTLNILAPGVVTHHFTGGAAYKLSDADTLEFAGMFAPETSVTGIEMTPGGPNPARTITDHMYQFEAMMGWTHHF